MNVFRNCCLATIFAFPKIGMLCSCVSVEPLTATVTGLKDFILKTKPRLTLPPSLPPSFAFPSSPFSLTFPGFMALSDLELLILLSHIQIPGARINTISHHAWFVFISYCHLSPLYSLLLKIFTAKLVENSDVSAPMAAS